MQKKIALISLVLIGFVFIFSGSAWAGRDHRRGPHYQKSQHNGGHYYKKHRGWRHNRGRHYGPRYRHQGHRPYRRTIEKHVYHHTSSDEDNSYASDDQYQVAGTLGDPTFSFSFGISGSR